MKKVMCKESSCLNYRNCRFKCSTGLKLSHTPFPSCIPITRPCGCHLCWCSSQSACSPRHASSASRDTVRFHLQNSFMHQKEILKYCTSKKERCIYLENDITMCT